MRMFVVAAATIVIVSIGGWVALNSVQQPVGIAFATAGARPDLVE